jgi:VanZ family protein
MQHPLRRFVRALTVCLALVIVLLSLLPLPQPPVADFLLADKIGHALAYLVLSFLVFASQLPGPRLRLVLAAVGSSVALGALMELIQPLTHRHRELGDLLANLVGSTVGALLALAVANWLKRLMLRQGKGR